MIARDFAVQSRDLNHGFGTLSCIPSYLGTQMRNHVTCCTGSIAVENAHFLLTYLLELVTFHHKLFNF